MKMVQVCDEQLLSLKSRQNIKSKKKENVGIYVCTLKASC